MCFKWGYNETEGGSKIYSLQPREISAALFANEPLVFGCKRINTEYILLFNLPSFGIQAIDGTIDDFDDDDDDIRATKRAKKRKKRGSMDDDEDDDDPPVSFGKKKRGASSGVGLDKAGEQKLKRQCKKIMEIVIKYADR